MRHTHAHGLAGARDAPNPSPSVTFAHLLSANSQRATEGAVDTIPILKTPSPRPKVSRVIKTFDDVEVEKLVTRDEWYEELNCGMCVDFDLLHRHR